MQTNVTTIGQTEIATITHEGHEYTALGASTQGRHVTAYVATPKPLGYGHKWSLTNWRGRTIVACRSWTAETYHTEYGQTHAIVFGLTHGRFLVGYSLGEGALFRGELTECESVEDAEREAKTLAEYWIERDYEDALAFDAELWSEESEQSDDE